MAQSLHISIADSVMDEIKLRMEKEGKTNRSEYVEEIIRRGLKKR